MSLNKNTYSNILIYLIPLISWSLAWTGVYPGILNIDHGFAKAEAITGEFSGTFPYLHILLLQLAGKSSLNLGLLLFIQTFLFALLTSSLIINARKIFNTNHIISVLICIFVSFYPPIVFHVVNATKDSQYALCLLWASNSILRKNTNSKFAELEFLLALLVSCFFRFNGILIATLATAIYAITFHSYWKGRLLLILKFFLAFILLDLLIHNTINYPRPSAEIKLQGLIFDLGAFVSSNTIDPQNQDVVFKIFPEEKWNKFYNCKDASGILLYSGWYKEKLPNNGKDISAIWFDQISSHPLIYLQHRLCAAQTIIYPSSANLMTLNPMLIGKDYVSTGRSEVVTNPLFNFSNNYANFLLKNSFIYSKLLFWNSALPFVLILLGLLTIVFKPDFKILFIVAIAPSLLNILFWIAAMFFPDIRFIFPSFIPITVLVFSILGNFKPKS